MVLLMEHLIEMDDWGVPLFQETSIWDPRTRKPGYRKKTRISGVN